MEGRPKSLKMVIVSVVLYIHMEYSTCRRREWFVYYFDVPAIGATNFIVCPYSIDAEWLHPPCVPRSGAI